MSVGKLEQKPKGRLVMLINCQFDAISRAESSVWEQKPGGKTSGQLSCP